MSENFDFGPLILDNATLFRIWAPLQPSMILQLETGEQHAMQVVDGGWHHCQLPGVGAGTQYRFRQPDDLAVPDPASRFQPHDVHGPSEVVDLNAHTWKTGEWSGRPWEEMVIYELHVGTFTQDGGFLAAIDKLNHLQTLGVTAIQLMPLSDFPGRYGWGYDGVLPYAPDSSYGRPEHLMALVDAAHARGICVFLDVVYNHFGPDGNYMPNYAPLFTDHHMTPWGKGINYDDKGGKPVREFVIQNAIYWITQFRLDGLRLDAVHAIKDDSEEHVLHELARRVRQTAGSRHVHLIVENEDNNSDLLLRKDGGDAEHFTAQWNDDIHHVLHIAATGETFGYYQDYVEDDANLGRALAEGFVFQGQHMPYRGEERGKSTGNLPPTAFISFTQNHDQVGNRANGDRMSSYTAPEPLKAIAAVCLLAPQIPMLFMGEEWGAKEPFPFFCEFDDELNEKVRKGRREELSRLPGFDGDNVSDPVAYETFASAKLDWSRAESGDGAKMLAFYRSLIDIRHQHVVPLLKAKRLGPGTFQTRSGVVTAVWTLANGTELWLAANLSGVQAAAGDIPEDSQRIFTFGQTKDSGLGPWSVIWSLRHQN
ncbi:1,4-alpha-glucan branching enzyme/maltooligosyltrehalose trehalohydrolase [Rhizobium skierniewicense]|uniref:Malto-oligosyltrehalose trehalohydrolase n=1 Tax=Rhizobium skierniewicense TaxID=984260 RepID=A0A7W6C7N7_9HYPH|nr:malto-oligosyltrehalose trehalohydrolase [Rhizobium skierniewicense]MBB3945493.1 1,4-alpha-glucan branching enzyme/maltooligosyltrehalose trehalohydrolase [Rhizobium skierniewicense]